MAPGVPVWPMWVGDVKHVGRGEILPIPDPATGEVFATCYTASEADVKEIVRLAHDTFMSGVWSKASRHHRATILDHIAAILRANLVALISMEIPGLPRWSEYYAALLRTEEQSVTPVIQKMHSWTDRRPLGVVVQITSFHEPLFTAIEKVAPALAAGNSIILKPSELTPLSSLSMGRFLKHAGVPDGVFSVTPGTGEVTGAALVSHPLVRRVDFRGSTAVGMAIGSIVGGNLAQYTAELGGKGPVIVFEQVDTDAVVNGIVIGGFIASGQSSRGATRIMISNKVLPSIREKLKIKLESIARRMGSPSNKESMIGPMTSLQQLKLIQRLVNEATKSANATLLSGGERMNHVSQLDGTDFSKGLFYPPTVLISSQGGGILNTRIWSEEAFGPVIAVVSFDTEEQAVKLANASEFGLGAIVWTNDLSQAFRVSEQIEAGMVCINAYHIIDPCSPWGGCKPSSGMGSKNGIEAYNSYTTRRNTVVNVASTQELLKIDWFKDHSKDVRME